MDLGDDKVSGVGVFTSATSADTANPTAKSWTVERIAPFVDSSLETRAGAVLVDYRPATI